MHAHMKADGLEAGPLTQLFARKLLARERSEGGPQRAPVRIFATDHDTVSQAPAHDLKAEPSHRRCTLSRRRNRRREVYCERRKAQEQIPHDILAGLSRQIELADRVLRAANKAIECEGRQPSVQKAAAELS